MMSFRPPWEDGQPYQEVSSGPGPADKARGGLEIPRRDTAEFYIKWVTDHLPPQNKRGPSRPKHPKQSELKRRPRAKAGARPIRKVPPIIDPTSDKNVAE